MHNIFALINSSATANTFSRAEFDSSVANFVPTRATKRKPAQTSTAIFGDYRYLQPALFFSFHVRRVCLSHEAYVHSGLLVACAMEFCQAGELAAVERFTGSNRASGTSVS